MPDNYARPPMMALFAGPNGAGKSTLRELWDCRRPLGVIIDTDAIALKCNLTDLQAGRENGARY